MAKTRAAPRKRPGKINFNQPYAKHVDNDPSNKARFVQNFRFYDAGGDYLGELPAECRPAKPVVVQALVARESREEKIAKAAAKLGDLGIKGGVPQTLQEARRENQQAAAAEENAD